ncbi:hypothetical protein FSS13T_18730 [Flavobacterium saliperosum S13]|uniref:Uncharacterized protein n=2 Tax=Flavobacterium saliperosum TaxID=329186 RepID=A0A1G4W7Y6_9FLAO|nr:hypothetical protein [Flavobacterium saliperosum]ESU24975.1 hypothetical protein FSS13T_18730 [Flavobacterium saliperosum S13]SCX18191.1 hypothetical protein SAMN02927925_02636 [Flavobacterium saliperosum]
MQINTSDTDRYMYNKITLDKVPMLIIGLLVLHSSVIFKEVIPEMHKTVPVFICVAISDDQTGKTGKQSNKPFALPQQNSFEINIKPLIAKRAV